MAEIIKQTAEWRTGTITEIIVENPRVHSFTIDLPGLGVHYAGQHCDVRLTAPDGYQATRAYSFASPPEWGDKLQITVQMIPGGEVSGYLDSAAKVGDQIEIKGPVGYHLIWRASENDRPVGLIAGGSGVVPLMSMLRHHKESGAKNDMKLLYSARTHQDLIYQSEILNKDFLSDGRDAAITLTEAKSTDWAGYDRLIDPAMIQEVFGDLDRDWYICGPTPMVEAVATHLTSLGVSPELVKTERFGPTG
jgi:ferredoxin-NADP reductase